LKDYFSPSSASDFRNCSARFRSQENFPNFGKGIGEGIRGFKSAMKEQPEPPAITANVTANDHNK
jgi:hypothetical protein